MLTNLKQIFCFGFLMLFVYTLNGQTGGNPVNLRLFLDCQWGCDFQYFRQELPHIDFVRDRQESEIFIQLIRQRSANGGSQFSLQVSGQERFQGMQDTVVFFTNPEDSDNVQRNAILAGLEKAILPFLVKTNWADKISYDITILDDEITQSLEDEDPWNYWVFRINAGGFFSGESSFRRSSIQSRFTASHVTDQNKFFLSASINQNRTQFELASGTEINKNNSSNLFILYAKSITDHWSVGGFGSARTSDFSNISKSYSIKPAIEYTIFPYSENTTREFKILYRVGLVYNDYIQPTTFDLTEQHIIQHNLDVEYKIIKDWGTVGIDFEIDNYPRDIKQSSISLSPEIEWNVFKGFSFNLWMELSYIADRINVTKDALSDEEILLGIRQLDSNFSYFANFNISYRFGSQTNNVVNTRF